MNYKKKSSTSWLRFQLRFPKELLTKADFLKSGEHFWISIWILHDMIVLRIILFIFSTQRLVYSVWYVLCKSEEKVSWNKYHHHNLTKAVQLFRQCHIADDTWMIAFMRLIGYQFQSWQERQKEFNSFPETTSLVWGHIRKADSIRTNISISSESLLILKKKLCSFWLSMSFV